MSNSSKKISLKTEYAYKTPMSVTLAKYSNNGGDLLI